MNNLNTGTTYYWRVNAVNDTSTGVWSNVWNFTTVFGIPTTPTLSSPSNNAFGQAISLNLSWNSVGGAAAYSLQVATGSDFSAIDYGQNDSAATSQTVAGLAMGTAYYWRVNASNPLGTSSWSSIWMFTTGTPLGAPVLSLPTNGAANQPSSLTLSWNTVSNALSYALQTSNSSDFSNLTQIGNLTSTSYSISSLPIATIYYWRVNATNGVGSGAWSSVWSFMTIGAAPGAPTLTSPANNTVSELTTLDLNWSPSSGASSYTIQLSTDTDFISFSQVNTSTNTDYVTGLSINTTYYWRVSATNAFGTSAWSSIWKFATYLSSVLPSGATALKPSCFINGNNLSYAIAQSGTVKISFSDILGREKAVINRLQSSGQYTVSLQSFNLTPGVYFLHFKAGNMEKRMKVMVTGRYL
jgi:hypothetical protein